MATVGLMENELYRVSTFTKWKDNGLSAIHLARSGFYYSGVEDKVICYVCKVELDRWTSNDNVWERHRRQSPGCQLVNQNKGDDLSTRATHLGSPEVNNTYTSNAIAGTGSEKQEEDTRTRLSSHPDFQASPKHPEYSDPSSRIKSFESRIVPHGQTPSTLAEAGFFYIGPGDKVMCFECGGNLKDWEPEDDPWEKHKLRYRTCNYLRTRRLASELPAHEPSVPQQTSTAVGSFRVERDEIKALMDTATVRSILNMGHDRDLIKKAIETRLTNKGDDFPNAETLLEAIYALQDEATPQASSFPLLNHSTTTSTASPSRSPSQSVESSHHLSGSAYLPTVQIASSSSTSSSACTHVRVPNECNMASTTGSELFEKAQSKSNGKRKKNQKENTTIETIEQEQKQERETPSKAEPKLSTVGLLDGGGKHKLDNGSRDEETLKLVEENHRLCETKACKVCMESEASAASGSFPVEPCEINAPMDTATECEEDLVKKAIEIAHTNEAPIGSKNDDDIVCRASSPVDEAKVPILKDIGAPNLTQTNVTASPIQVQDLPTFATDNVEWRRCRGCRWRRWRVLLIPCKHSICNECLSNSMQRCCLCGVDIKEVVPVTPTDLAGNEA